MKSCGAIIEARGRGGKNRGRLCGRPVVAFLLPGVGRCGYHDTVMERTRALALLDALRDARELRACPREPEQGRENEQQADDDEPTDSLADFDPGGFADPSLDEA